MLLISIKKYDAKWVAKILDCDKTLINYWDCFDRNLLHNSVIYNKDTKITIEKLIISKSE